MYFCVPRRAFSILFVQYLGVTARWESNPQHSSVYFTIYASVGSIFINYYRDQYNGLAVNFKRWPEVTHVSLCNCTHPPVYCSLNIPTSYRANITVVCSVNRSVSCVNRLGSCSVSLSPVGIFLLPVAWISLSFVEYPSYL
jgi:hypothetical protein